MIFNKNQLVGTLEGLPGIIGTYFENIPEEALDRKRSESAWTIREHLYHIADVQEMLFERILKIKDEKEPVITPYFPQNETHRDMSFTSVSEALKHYREHRSRQIKLINELSEDEFCKKAVHNEYISYNVPVIINHMIFHEYWHMYRIEELWLTRNEYFS